MRMADHDYATVGLVRGMHMHEHARIRYVSAPVDNVCVQRAGCACYLCVCACVRFACVPDASVHACVCPMSLCMCVCVCVRARWRALRLR